MAGSGAAKVTLPTDEQILIVRELDASRELLYRAWTTPDLLSRWWTGSRGTKKSAEVTFADVEGRTAPEILIQYETRQDRDAHSASMGDGLQEALDLLEEVASS